MKTPKLPPLYAVERGIPGSMHHIKSYCLSEKEAREDEARLASYWEDHPAAQPCVLATLNIEPWTKAEQFMLGTLRHKLLTRLEFHDENQAKKSIKYRIPAKHWQKVAMLSRLETVGVITIRESNSGELNSVDVCLTALGRKWLLENSAQEES